MVFQYSFCSYSTVYAYNCCKLCAVSIQLLFLFNNETGVILLHHVEFQYSFCSYSTVYAYNCCKLCAVSIQLLFLFNENWNIRFPITARCFNTASVLIQPTTKQKYINHYRVSIQLLFLFNEIVIERVFRVPGFNTASVLIQLEKANAILVARGFQYSFCSYSTCTCISISFL